MRTRDEIRPEASAYDLGIEIIEADLDGASAQLIRLGDLVKIVLSERITESGARRFAIAHELYHFLKRHPSLSPTMMCKRKWLRTGAQEPHPHEIGSNAFGSAVLLGFPASQALRGVAGLARGAVADHQGIRRLDPRERAPLRRVVE